VRAPERASASPSAIPTPTESACPSDPQARVAPEATAERAGAGELLGRDEPLLHQAGVQHVHGVPLAEQEVVARPRVRSEAQEVEDERGHQVRGGERAPEVRELGAGHRHHVPAQRRGAPFELAEEGDLRHG
jgi:hypothetical protein